MLGSKILEEERGIGNRTLTLGWPRSELARSLLLAPDRRRQKLRQDSAGRLGRKYHGGHPDTRSFADCRNLEDGK